MTGNKELLEYAFIAAAPGENFVYESDAFYEGFVQRNFEEDGMEIQPRFWNPLDSAHDALTLQVKYSMTIACSSDADGYIAIMTIYDGQPFFELLHGSGSARTLQRAITNVAASIGRYIKAKGTTP